jgi:hypothetical protein
LPTNSTMSDRFTLEYELHEHGWATARLMHGDDQLEMLASYLHDSLKQLADAALQIARGPANTTVVFMDEPGEHQLTVTRLEDDVCHYAVDWCDDWHSWGMRKHGSQHPSRVAEGETESRRFIQQVNTVLWRLFDEYGTDGYKERWCEHAFPLHEMQRLAGLKRG